jgi:zinc transport system ATP-binding protein
LALVPSAAVDDPPSDMDFERKPGYRVISIKEDVLRDSRLVSVRSLPAFAPIAFRRVTVADVIGAFAYRPRIRKDRRPSSQRSIAGIMERNMVKRILSIKQLSVLLGGQSIIKGLNLEVLKGDNLAVIGPNGSGKTVLLKTLLGFFPFAGRIDWAPGTKVGYVPQKVDVDLHLPLTLENLLQAKAQVMAISRGEIKKVLDIVNLSVDILKTPVGHLSGGQFQKALICFSLLGGPDVLLFDEPTASLDQLAEEHIYELIDELQKKQEITVILVSHDLNILYQYATKVLCLNRERFCFGRPQELNPDTLETVYGSPLKHYQHEHH